MKGRKERRRPECDMVSGKRSRGRSLKVTGKKGSFYEKVGQRTEREREKKKVVDGLFSVSAVSVSDCVEVSRLY